MFSFEGDNNRCFFLLQYLLTLAFVTVQVRKWLARHLAGMPTFIG